MHHLRALRPHQWVKNVFVFAALVFAGKLTDSEAALQALLAFVAFCAAASAIYLVNDVADYERDRLHPKKKRRPIASGLVARRTALLMSAGLAPLGLGLAWSLNHRTGAVVTAYTVVNVLYSFGFKHLVLLDVFVIATGFLLRVIAGAFAIDVGVSPWLLICTFFGALFLAFCKRRNELTTLGEDAAAHRGNLAAYSTVYIDKMVSSLAGMTVMSYALYTIDPRVMARLGTDGLVLTVPLVLFGVFRYLYLVHQEGKGGSPTEVLLTDRSVQAITLLLMVSVVGLIYFQLDLGLVNPLP